FVETISSKQSELDTFIAEGYKTALSEERRRYCFLVDRQCAVAKNSSAYHGKGKDLLTQKIPVWQQACSDPNKLPERAMLLAQQMGSGSGTGTASLIMGGSSPMHTSKSNLSNLVISDPIPGAQPLPVPPELAVFMGGGLGHQAPAKNKTSVGETRTLPRSSSMAAGLEKNGRARVQAIFSHAAGDNSTLLSFSEGDVITLLARLVPLLLHTCAARDLHHGKSSSTGNLLESDMSLPMPDYGLTARLLAQSLAQSRPRPYSMAGFATQPALEDYDSRFAAASGGWWVEDEEGAERESQGGARPPIGLQRFPL
ncbi:unnamed protein product, partial [Coregonus sp. 'balchen']